MKTSGFTLVELVIVTAILMVLMGRSLVAVKDFSDRQDIKNEALTVVEYLRQAQVGAAAGNASGCEGSFSGTRVTLSNDNDTSKGILTIATLCVDGEIKTIMFKRGSFCNSIPKEITFSVPGGYTEATTIEICLDSVKKYKIDVLLTGSVSEPTEI